MKTNLSKRLSKPVQVGTIAKLLLKQIEETQTKTRKMGLQIIKQPNGRYCIFSSIDDCITHYNMQPKDIIKQWVKESEQDITERVNKVVEKLKKGGRPYYQFTMDFDEMMETIKEQHGKKEFEKIIALILNKS